MVDFLNSYIASLALIFVILIFITAKNLLAASDDMRSNYILQIWSSTGGKVFSKNRRRIFKRWALSFALTLVVFALSFPVFLWAFGYNTWFVTTYLALFVGHIIYVWN